MFKQFTKNRKQNKQTVNRGIIFHFIDALFWHKYVAENSAIHNEAKTFNKISTEYDRVHA